VEEPLDSVLLLPEEIELLRLVDLEGLEQEEAAATLGVSRRTAWRDLHEARRKVADALIHGKNIDMKGCRLEPEGRCPRREEDLCPREAGGSCPKRWCRTTPPGPPEDF
jgi:Predicted DNA-binding proteins